MKTFIKKKTELKSTGNKRIKGSQWQKDLLEIMNKNENPIFYKVPGSISVNLNINRI